MKQVYLQRIAENDALIRSARLDHGREIIRARTAIHTDIIVAWVREELQRLGHDRPFAVVALGGTGREEVTPASDIDIAFLVDDQCAGNELLRELHRQTKHTREFEERSGFRFTASAYRVGQDEGFLDELEMNAFLDMRPLHDPHGLAEKFRARIRATHSAFSHFLMLRNEWQKRWQSGAGNVERIDRVDLKEHCLRAFQIGVWVLAGRDYRHSHDIYRTLADPQVLHAFDFIHRLRSWLHLHRQNCPTDSSGARHEPDIMTFDDFAHMDELLGPEATIKQRRDFADEVRQRFIDARCRIAAFARGILGCELASGRPVAPGSPIVLGASGLRHTDVPPMEDPVARSGAALSLLAASQQYGVPVDPAELEATFLCASRWLMPVPELASLFYEEGGRLSMSLGFLAQIPEALERLFPGHTRFDSSLDERVIQERQQLRGAFMRQKIAFLEEKWQEGRKKQKEQEKWREQEQSLVEKDFSDPAFHLPLAEEIMLLDDASLAAVKLALLTKRLPVVDGDLAESPTSPVTGGFSGIPVAEYYTRCFAGCDFNPETLELARFLVENRRLLRELADGDLMDDQQMSGLLSVCGKEEKRVRALHVFTCADRSVWESEIASPATWFNIHELHAKVCMTFRPQADPTLPLARAGYSADELDILRDFGSAFFRSGYRHYAIRMGMSLLKLAQAAKDARPRVYLIRTGHSVILGIAAKDDHGLAARITRVLWKHGLEIDQAHLFSSTLHRLALDFFHLKPDTRVILKGLAGEIESAIQQLQLTGEDEPALPSLPVPAMISEWRDGLCRITVDAESQMTPLTHALCCRISRSLQASIHGLAAHRGQSHSWVSIYLKLPPSCSLEHARQIISTW